MSRMHHCAFFALPFVRAERRATYGMEAKLGHTISYSS